MPLTAGTRVGPYTVVSSLGAGGMGEVYRARDTKLDREVALKILPDTFATDPDRLMRFEREAKTLAALNHPNIAQIYGLEQFELTQTEGVVPPSGSEEVRPLGQALVLEYVEGRTLDELIRSGAAGGLKTDDALAIARQIAEALEAAHEQGIIHRDLKPANVKVRDDGAVKVLDFGLAKALEPAGMSGASSVSMSPTITSPAMTQMGMILGTAAYMSPEQARGRPVDRRADIWAFGCVLYEMLTGKRVFEGDDVSVTLARVLEREPSFEQLPPGMPARVRTVLDRCLQKDPRQRVRDIGDVRLALDGAFETVVPSLGESVASLPSPLWRRAVPFAATALAMTGVFLAVGWAVWPSPPAAPVTRSTHLLPEGVTFRGTHRSLLAIAPDASRFVYNSAVGLRVRERDSVVDRVIPGTEQGVTNPFFSPDGLSVGFMEGGGTGQLRKIAVNGGASTPLTPQIANLFGASWDTDGTILYGQPDGIWRVSANGGEPEHVIVTEPGEQADGPQLLPGGEWVLFAVTRASGPSRWDEAEIVAQSLVTDERRHIRQGGSDPRYLPTGHLLYARQDVLYAVPFDVSRLEETGGPSPVVEGVMRSSGGQVNGGAAMAAVATDGTLVYVPGAPEGSRVLVHVNARGEARPLGVPEAGYQALRVSPNGMFVAAEVAREDVTAIWVADLTRATLSPVTSVDAVGDFAPVWSPDGSQIIYVSQRDGVWGFYRRSADGVGAEELLIQVEGAVYLAPGNWSPDGRSLVFTMRKATGTRDVAVLSLDGDATWRPLLNSDADESYPVISPNGQWFAYSSDEGGSQEVYLQRFPDLGGRQQVSINSGIDPVWAPDGRTLYYISTRGNGPPAAMAAVSVDPAPTLSIGTPEELFPHSPYRRPQRTTRWYDVMPGGDGFVMVTAAPTAGGDAPAPQVITVQSWFEELKRLVPKN